MAYHLTHYTNINGPQSLFNTIKDFVVNTLGWTLKETGTVSGSYGRDYAIFYSDGESTQEDIFVGFNWYYYTTQRTGVQINAYTGYDSAYGYDNLGNLGTSISNGVYTYLPSFLLQDTSYDHVWLGGDKDCIWGVVRCVTAYPCFYVGLLRRFWSRQFDPYPLYVFGSFCRSVGNAPSSYDWNYSSYFRGIAGDRSVRDFLWYNQDEWHHDFSYYPADPGTGYNIDAGTAKGQKKIYTANPFIHGLTLPNSQRLISTFIISDETGARGEIKHVYKLSRAVAVDPEDEITINSITYKVFPSTFDLNVAQWYAIKLS